MSKNWNNLYEKYPQFFENMKNKYSPMVFGIECNTGWYQVISSVCYRINQYEENIKSRTKYKQKEDPTYESKYNPVKFDQIKQKFGGLRIYFSGGDDYIKGVVDMAEEISYKTCEICGNQGSPNKNGWITTLCNEHKSCV